MTVRVAINGFGRIGRNVLRAIIESGRTDIEQLAPIEHPAPQPEEGPQAPDRRQGGWNRNEPGTRDVHGGPAGGPVMAQLMDQQNGQQGEGKGPPGQEVWPPPGCHVIEIGPGLHQGVEQSGRAPGRGGGPGQNRRASR